MRYHVTAKLNEGRAREFHARLTDGSIASLQPDGTEMVKAMNRARIGEDGKVRWTESCFCESPLQHERETVLDRYFSDIQAEEVAEWPDLTGASLMDRLAKG